MFLQRILAAAFLALSVTAVAVQAAPDTQIDGSRPTISIFNNSGGNIALFALSVAEYRGAGTLVKFNGNCDSACTLYLGLPSHQTCLNSGAAFRFHAPFGVANKSQKIAQDYLLSKYPGWVRSWINRKNGLTSELITMDYDYASKFMHICGGAVSREASSK